jgi:hypothetical protein
VLGNQSASLVHVLGFTATTEKENDETAISVVACHCNLWLQWLLLAHDRLCLLSTAIDQKVESFYNHVSQGQAQAV